MPKKKEGKIIEEINRHNSVLVEHMEHQVKTVAEGHSSIIGKLNEHGEQFNKINQGFDSLENTIGTVLREHEGRIKKVEEKVGT